MSRAKVILLASGTLIVGLAIGAAGGIWFSSTMFGGFGAITAAAGVSTKVHILEGIRSNDLPRSTEMLESLLDSDLITLDAMLSEQSYNAEDSILRSIRRAKEYRDKHPRNTEYSEIDQSVNRILLKAPQPK